MLERASRVWDLETLRGSVPMNFTPQDVRRQTIADVCSMKSGKGGEQP